MLPSHGSWFGFSRLHSLFDHLSLKDESQVLGILWRTAPWLQSYRVSGLTGYNILIQLTASAGHRMASFEFFQNLCLPGVITFQRKFIQFALRFQNGTISELRVTRQILNRLPPFPEIQVCCENFILILDCGGNEQIMLTLKYGFSLNFG